MRKLGRKMFSLSIPLAVAALLATAGGMAAQAGGAQEEKQPPVRQPAQARTVPHVTGTVTLWNGNRMDLKTREGKALKVAVNEYTKRLVEIRKGAEVTVEYRRKIGGFYIAKRVLEAGEGAAAAQPAATPGQDLKTVTGSVVSGNQTEVVLRTSTGDIPLFLSPRTEYLVKPAPGILVTVEYRQGADGARVAARVLAGDESPPQ